MNMIYAPGHNGGPTLIPFDIPGVDPERTLICDTECYGNFWSIGFWRLSDGKQLIMEHSERKPLNRERVRKIMRENLIIGFNLMGYDNPMITLATMDGVTNRRLKQANDQIIVGKLKYWEVEQALDIVIPRWDYIDLMEPQPNAWASLKMLQGRLHGQKMQDLPYSPDTMLTEEQMDVVLAYMGNDLESTYNLLVSLVEPLKLRAAFGKKYGLDLMSKSDSQCGEAIFKKRVKDKTGEKVYKVETPPGTIFKYDPPPYIKFAPGGALDRLFERLRGAEFIVGADKKVIPPPWLESCQIAMGESIYSVGIGGLHSTESCRSICADEDHVLADFDVGSYYPNTILRAGLYPLALGPAFLDIYGEMTEERMQAKFKAIDEALSEPIRLEFQTTADGVKIFVNGGGFGKLGSGWSVMFAPHVMINVTLTGQLALLMLIERAEAAGVKVVSANTDGVVFYAPRDMLGPIVKDRVTSGIVADLVEEWEADTGFSLEATEYASLHNASVNEYIAIKPNGKAKRKGKLGNPYKENLRTQLTKNPNMGICSDAVVDFLVKGTPIEETILRSRDIRDFVTIIQVKGGGTWRGNYLGKVVRYIWSTDGAEIKNSVPHETTGNFKTVAKSDGCRPVMDLPDEFPTDIDYDRYIAEAREILMNIGFEKRPELLKPIRLFKWSAMAYFAIAV